MRDHEHYRLAQALPSALTPALLVGQATIAHMLRECRAPGDCHSTASLQPSGWQFTKQFPIRHRKPSQIEKTKIGGNGGHRWCGERWHAIVRDEAGALRGIPAGVLPGKAFDSVDIEDAIRSAVVAAIDGGTEGAWRVAR